MLRCAALCRAMLSHAMLGYTRQYDNMFLAPFQSGRSRPKRSPRKTQDKCKITQDRPKRAPENAIVEVSTKKRISTTMTTTTMTTTATTTTITTTFFIFSSSEPLLEGNPLARRTASRKYCPSKVASARRPGLECSNADRSSIYEMHVFGPVHILPCHFRGPSTTRSHARARHRCPEPPFFEVEHFSQSFPSFTNARN